MSFKEKLLGEFLLKYEKRLKERTLGKRDISVFCDKDKLFKEEHYYSDDAFKYRSNIENEVKEIEELGFIECIRNCEELIKIILNVNKIEEIYKFLGKEKIENLKEANLQFLNNQLSRNNCVIANNYLVDTIANVEKYHFKGVRDENEFQQKLFAINEICKDKEEILIRNFSKKIFNDSKKFESIGESIYLPLFNKYGEQQFCNFEEFCSFYSIVKTPSFINFKGNVEVIFCNGSKINISDFQYGIGICAKDIDKLDKIIVNDDRLFTIENYTKFLSFYKTNATIVYLAGYHNKDKNIFLQKIHERNNHLKYFHYGDIDYGGINIYNNLKAKSGIPFQMYNMDIETMITHKKYWSILSNNDRINLKRLKEKLVEHRVLIDFMLENNCKLEQEAIDDMDNF